MTATLTDRVQVGPASRPSLILPRFGTPRNPSRPTRGGEVAEVARRLGKPLMPWQRHAVDVALEIDPETGELWYEEVVLTVPRQSGKTTLILALMVWRCIVMPGSFDPAIPQTVTYLAQSGKMARRKLEREFARIMRSAKSLEEIRQLSRERPERLHQWKLSMNNGSENIYFGSGSYLQIEAPTGTGSHGDVLDMSVIDEAFSHEDDLVEQAVDAASVTRRSPQSCVVSTAGNERSVYLARKVLGGRKACLDGGDSRTCFMEWSVPDDLPHDDPAVWAEYLPAYGHTITEKRLRSRLEKAMRNPDEVDEEGFEPGLAGFKRGYLNQWPKWPVLRTGNENAVIGTVTWDVAADLTPSPLGGGRLALSWSVSADRDVAAVGFVGERPDGRRHGQVLQVDDGTEWVPARLVKAAKGAGARFVALGYNPKTGAALLPQIEAAFKKAGISLGTGKESKLIKVGGQQYIAACGAYFDGVTAVNDDGERAPQILHSNQDWLNKAVLSAGWSTARQWVSKAHDISPLEQQTIALWALETAPVDERTELTGSLMS